MTCNECSFDGSCGFCNRRPELSAHRASIDRMQISSEDRSRLRDAVNLDVKDDGLRVMLHRIINATIDTVYPDVAAWLATDVDVLRLRDYAASNGCLGDHLNSLRDNALRIAVGHGFTDATPGEDIALMHSELSEGLEDIRGGKGLNETWYEAKKPFPKPCGVPSEMADIVIRVLHFCGKHGIDLDRAVAEKMAYNESRPFKHGGKKL